MSLKTIKEENDSIIKLIKQKEALKKDIEERKNQLKHIAELIKNHVKYSEADLEEKAEIDKLTAIEGEIK